MPDYRDDVIVLLDAIYQAVLEPTSWRSVSAHLLELLDADFSHMLITDFFNDAYDFGVERDADGQWQTHQHRIFDNDALRTFLHRQPANSVVCSGGQDTPDNLLTVKQPCAEFIATYIELANEHVGWYMFGRRQAANGFSEAQKGLLTQLIPHLGRTYRITANLSYSNQMNSFVVETLNQVSAGIVILSGGGDVISVNDAAEYYIRQGDIRIEDGRLVLVNREASRQLDELLHRPIANPAEKSFFIQYQRESGRQLFLACQPQKTTGDGGYWMPEAPKAQMVIFITDSESLIDLPWEKLKAIFSFTAAEANVARLLVNGATTEDIANTLGIATNSVRFHLKNCFSKAQVTSQVELVGLLLRTIAKLPH